MKRFAIALAIAALAAPAAWAQLYKYVDKDGKTVYTDTPPPSADPKMISAPSAPSASKSFVERDKEMEKLRQKERDAAKKAQKAEQTANAQEERCRQAKERMTALAEGGRIYKYNDKGEREIMVDEEIEAERVKSQKTVDEACKKS
jgi:uncharacterized protein DUF4124